MRQTLRLLDQGVKLVMFSRQNCSLCDTAKSVVHDLCKKRPDSKFIEIDVMSKGQEGWRDLYEFDTPVLHVQPDSTPIEPGVTARVFKLMHRFSEDQVNDLITKVEQST